MIGLLKSLVRDDSGATAIEYGLIASLISISAIAGFEAMGMSFSAMFGKVSNELKVAVQQASGGS